MTITDKFAQERGYKDGLAYKEAFEGTFKNSKVNVDNKAIMNNKNISTFRDKLKGYFESGGTNKNGSSTA
jgi:hypothetical protein